MAQHIDRRKLLATIGGTSILGIAGCLGDDDDDDTDDTDDAADTADDGDDSDDAQLEAIDLGILMGVTGGLEQLGPPIRDAAEVAVDQVNDGDVDLEVNTQFEDTGTNPDDGIMGAESIRDAGVPMFVGALASDVSIPVAESVAIPDGLVMNSPASTAPAYTDLEGDYTFRTTISDAYQGLVLAEVARDRLGAETAAWIGRDDPYGRGLGEQFALAFENEGGEVTAEVTIDYEQDQFVSQLEDALSDDPDVLFIVAFPEEGVPLLSDLFGNFDTDEFDILFPDGLRDEGLPGNVGEDFTGITGTAPGVEDDLSAGIDYFEQQVDDSRGPFVRQGYDAAATLILAHAAAGSDDPDEIRDHLRAVTDPGGEVITAENLVEGVELALAGEEIEYQGVSGSIEFDENGDVLEGAFEYYEFTEDGIETIEILTVEEN